MAGKRGQKKNVQKNKVVPAQPVVTTASKTSASSAEELEVAARAAEERAAAAAVAAEEKLAAAAAAETRVAAARAAEERATHAAAVAEERIAAAKAAEERVAAAAAQKKRVAAYRAEEDAESSSDAAAVLAAAQTAEIRAAEAAIKYQYRAMYSHYSMPFMPVQPATSGPNPRQFQGWNYGYSAHQPSAAQYPSPYGSGGYGSKWGTPPPPGFRTPAVPPPWEQNNWPRRGRGGYGRRGERGGRGGRGGRWSEDEGYVDNRTFQRSMMELVTTMATTSRHHNTCECPQCLRRN